MSAFKNGVLLRNMEKVFLCTVVSIPFFYSRSFAAVSCFKGEGLGKG